MSKNADQLQYEADKTKYRQLAKMNAAERAAHLLLNLVEPRAHGYHDPPDQASFIPDDEQAQGAYPPAVPPDPPGKEPTALHIYARLVRKFGLGSCPERRKTLFCRLADEVTLRPDAERVIADCVQCAFGSDADGKPIANPANWFCRAVIRRLKESGFLSPAEDW